jgi:hypothetical protein
MLKVNVVDPMWLNTQGVKGYSRFIDPAYIPRIGDEIKWFNHSITKVKTVIWDFDAELVTVVVF